MNKHDLVMALAISIRLRDQSETAEKEELLPLVKQVCEYSLFSNRQISNLTKCKIHHNVVAKFSNKRNRTGGAINPNSLEDIRTLLFSYETGAVDWDLVSKVVSAGTSMTMLSKITGISKTTMSRKIGSIQ